MIFLRRQVPLLITLITGLVFAGQYYVPHPASEQMLTSVTKWLQIIGGFALVLGVSSLFHVHAVKIRRKEAGWGYSFVLYVGMLGTIAVGLWANGKEAVDGAMTAFGWVYNFMMVPLQSTMFAILAFFIASAAYRSFRARSREAAVLLIAAVIVMMGRVPLGEYLIPAQRRPLSVDFKRAECVGAARDPDRRQPRHGRAFHQDHLRHGTVVSGWGKRVA